MKSIRQFLTLVLVSSLILIIFSAAMHGYRGAMQASTQLMDKELNSVLMSVAYSHDITVPEHDDQGLVYQIWKDGQLTARSENAPLTLLTATEDNYSDQNFSGQRWRVYRKALADDTVIMVAQPLFNRLLLTESLTISAIIPFLITVPVLAILIFALVTHGLRPLKVLSDKLSARTGKDLSSINLKHVPAELDPVLTTLNTMFARLGNAFEREQQFASNAAHELRTPLSVMKINLHNLAREVAQGKQTGIDRFNALQNDTDRMIHAVNQILLLSRTSPEVFEIQKGKVDVVLIAQSVITDMYSKIESKGQEISLEGEHVLLRSTEFTLYTLLQNLIANASTYSPEGASIHLSIIADPFKTVIIIEDSGPGIPAEERSKVLQRFYRNNAGLTAGAVGSGLGLAIVGQIVQLHDGNISLSTSGLGGLKVRIELSNREQR